MTAARPKSVSEAVCVICGRTFEPRLLARNTYPGGPGTKLYVVYGRSPRKTCSPECLSELASERHLR